MRGTTLDIVQLTLTAIIVDICQKIDQVDRGEDDSDSVSFCSSDLDIETARELAETDYEESAGDPSNRLKKSMHAYRTHR